jgi:hypothetical protein
MLQKGREKLSADGKYGNEVRWSGLLKNNKPDTEHNTRRNLTDGLKWRLAQKARELLLEKGREQQGQRTDIFLNNKKKLKPHNTEKELAKELKWSSTRKIIYCHSAPKNRF